MAADLVTFLQTAKRNWLAQRQTFMVNTRKDVDCRSLPRRQQKLMMAIDQLRPVHCACLANQVSFAAAAWAANPSCCSCTVPAVAAT